MNRKFHNIVWLAILIPFSLEAADNPFVGTWRTLHDKAPIHKTYKFIAVGDKLYQTDNGVGLGPVLPTDGSVHESPLGGMVSLKQIDAKTFSYVMKKSTTYRRTMTIEGDTMKWDKDQGLALESTISINQHGDETAEEQDWQAPGSRSATNRSKSPRP